MATTTTDLGLTKPDPTELYNIAVENGNWDILEGNFGVTFCTSSSRPASPKKRRLIYETDTGRFYAWDGDSWERLAVSFNGDGNLDIGSAQLLIGDTNLYRSAANELKTDDTFVAADVKVGSASLPRGVVARNQRTTNISTSLGGGIIRAMSVRAPVKAGRSYRVAAMFEVDAATVPATSQDELRYTTNDTEPTTSSTVLNRTLMDHRVAAVPDGEFIETFFHATADGWLRVALCISRVLGSGVITLNAAATFPATLTVEDVGATVAESGTDY